MYIVVYHSYSSVVSGRGDKIATAITSNLRGILFRNCVVPLSFMSFAPGLWILVERLQLWAEALDR